MGDRNQNIKVAQGKKETKAGSQGGIPIQKNNSELKFVQIQKTM
jgi:hypothetical protein